MLKLIVGWLRPVLSVIVRPDSPGEEALADLMLLPLIFLVHIDKSLGQMRAHRAQAVHSLLDRESLEPKKLQAYGLPFD